MAEPFIVVSIDGLKEIEAKLAKLPEAVGDMGVDEANKYLLDVLQQYPPPHHVTRKAAYGQTFQSDKQRRYFFWALHKGIINVPYNRTQTLRKGWSIVGNGRTSFLANETPYADLVMGEGQSRMSKLIGWKQVGAILKERTAKVLEKFDVGVKKAIRKIGLA